MLFRVESPRILLVEDDPAVLQLMGQFATGLGFESVRAVDGQEAIECLAAEKFGLVVTDVNMPRVDGMELLAHIQKRHPRTGVIVVTGYSDRVRYTDVIQAGASDFLAKPFSRDEFEAKLHRIMREQEIRDELEHLSTCDALTGLHNRRRFDLRLWKESHRAERQQYPLYVAMVDVDHFKEFNDTYGHLAGDNALQSLARLLESCTRANVDMCFRYGGDEFTIIIPQTTTEQALEIAERIANGYHELNFGWTELSVGLARFRRRSGNSWARDVKDLVARADQAMYQAKADAKHNVIQYTD